MEENKVTMSLDEYLKMYDKINILAEIVDESVENMKLSLGDDREYLDIDFNSTIQDLVKKANKKKYDEKLKSLLKEKEEEKKIV